jgi:hypothetical protein
MVEWLWKGSEVTEGSLRERRSEKWKQRLGKLGVRGGGLEELNSVGKCGNDWDRAQGIRVEEEMSGVCEMGAGERGCD